MENNKVLEVENFILRRSLEIIKDNNVDIMAAKAISDLVLAINLQVQVPETEDEDPHTYLRRSMMIMDIMPSIQSFALKLVNAFGYDHEINTLNGTYHEISRLCFQDSKKASKALTKLIENEIVQDLELDLKGSRSFCFLKP